MTFVIRLRVEAENDIHDASVWYESQRLLLVHDFLDAVEAAFSRISENPLQFPILYRGARPLNSDVMFSVKDSKTVT